VVVVRRRPEKGDFNEKWFREKEVALPSRLGLETTKLLLDG
jgi:hypothetical protein